MASGALGALNPGRVAFHGWSGGAQMVSELVDVFARGELPGLTVKCAPLSLSLALSPSLPVFAAFCLLTYCITRAAGSV